MVLNSFDRYISVKYPTKLKFRSKFKYQLLALAILFVLLITIDLLFFFFYDVQISKNHISKRTCITTHVFIGFFIDLANLLVSTIIPFFLMMFCTISTGHHFIANKSRLQKTKSNFKNKYQFVKTMWATDIFFLVCNLPFCIQQLTFDIFAIKNRTFFYSTLIFDVSNLLIYIQCSCSFFIYLCCNNLFRRYFFSIFSNRHCSRSYVL